MSRSAAIRKVIRRSTRARWTRRLQAKVALAQQRGLAVSLVTQFGFEAQPILRWIAAQRAQGIDCPVHVGVAGPASVATLAKFAIRCGIGASLRALARGHTAFARILAEARPDGLIGELVAGEDAAGADRRSACLHLRRRAPYRGVDSHKRLNCDPRTEQNRNFGEPSLPGSAGFPLQIRAMVTGYPSYSAMYRQRIYVRRRAEGSDVQDHIRSFGDGSRRHGGTGPPHDA